MECATRVPVDPARAHASVCVDRLGSASAATRWRRRAPLVAAIAFALSGASGGASADLFFDDFSRFPPGLLSAPIGQLNGAIQEYHYLPHRGVPLGPWGNAICHLDAWVGRRRGRHAVPRAAHGQRAAAADEPAVRDRRSGVGRLHASKCRCRPLSLADMAGRGLPLPHQPPLLPVRADRRQRGAAGRAPADREDASASPSGASWRSVAVPLRHDALLHAAGRERGPAHPRLHRRQAGARGAATARS